jgi:ADP-ribose pyrophosphatase YjhB (NUDIX family)
MVGVGGVVIDGERVLLVRRGTEPARGEWSIPGGLLEVGETLAEGVVRELREETGLTVRVLELIEALDRIFTDSQEGQPTPDGLRPRPRYHYVILDYLCEVVAGEPTIREEITDLAFVSEVELEGYHLAPATMRVLHKAFAMARTRAEEKC